jgi:hypothetical protein
MSSIAILHAKLIVYATTDIFKRKCNGAINKLVHACKRINNNAYHSYEHNLGLYSKPF